MFPIIVSRKTAYVNLVRCFLIQTLFLFDIKHPKLTLQTAHNQSDTSKREEVMCLNCFLKLNTAREYDVVFLRLCLISRPKTEEKQY